VNCKGAAGRKCYPADSEEDIGWRWYLQVVKVIERRRYWVDSKGR
jgi:hypothetical protein